MVTDIVDTLLDEAVRFDVRAARRLSGLSQIVFAAQIGVTHTYLSDLERGFYDASPSLQAKICRRVGQSPEPFISIRPARPKKVAAKP